jgi:hypothetical protein
MLIHRIKFSMECHVFCYKIKMTIALNTIRKVGPKVHKIDY